MSGQQMTQRQFDFDEPSVGPQLVIQASAGTGKTFQLSNRYLSAVHLGAEPDRILATTFTRKAAAEILERILQRLARGAATAEQAQALASEVGHPELTQARCRVLLRRLTDSLHRLRICTLDAFFAQLAGSQSLELGFPPGWRMSDDSEESSMRARAVEQLLNQSDVATTLRLVHLLNKGTTSRTVSDLIDDTVRTLYQVYLVTPEDAWNQFPTLLRPKDQEVDAAIGRLEGLIPGLKKRLQTGVSKALAAYVAGKWADVIKSTLVVNAAVGERKYYGAAVPDEICDELAVLYHRAKAELVDQLKWRTEGTRELLCDYNQVFLAIQDESRKLRFTDVTLRLAGLPEGRAIPSESQSVFRIDGAVDHLFLDEFQDTSLEQWRVLRPFVRSIAEADRPTSFFCVGDPKQAIYGWRGGVAEIFDALPTELPDLKEEPLNRSFRSSPVIIDFVNRLFRQLGEKAAHPIVKSWCSAFPEHSAHWTKMPGYASVITSRQPPDPPQPDAGSSKKPGGPSVDEFRDEAVKTAVRLVQEYRQKSPDHNIGVLTRSNEMVGQLMTALNAEGIEASEEGGVAITGSPLVQVLLSLFELADHPGDTAAFMHVADSPLGIHFELESRDEEARRELSDRIRLQLIEDGYAAAIEQWAGALRESGTDRDRGRLNHLVAMAEEFQSRATLRPIDFVTFVEMQRVDDPSASRIRVMNIHQSKGLQFDIVILPDLERPVPGPAPTYVTHRPDPVSPPDIVALYCDKETRALLPPGIGDAYSDTEAGQYSEMLCVLYVAVTRAVNALHLIVRPDRDLARKKTLGGWVATAMLDNLADFEEVPEEEPLLELGDRDWWRDKDHSQSESRQLRQIQEIRFRERPESSTSAVWTNPSALEGDRKQRIGAIARPDRIQALDVGTVIHHWFEQIEWWDESATSEAARRRLAARLDISRQTIEKAEPRFLDMIANSRLQRLLSRAEYNTPTERAAEKMPWSTAVDELRVFRERRIAVRIGQQNLFGSIDRLVVGFANGTAKWADVIDFKTDRIAADEASIAHRADHYRGQLTAYQMSIMKLYSLPQESVRARLAFLDPGVVTDLG